MYTKLQNNNLVTKLIKIYFVIFGSNTLQAFVVLNEFEKAREDLEKVNKNCSLFQPNCNCANKKYTIEKDHLVQHNKQCVPQKTGTSLHHLHFPMLGAGCICLFEF